MAAIVTMLWRRDKKSPGRNGPGENSTVAKSKPQDARRNESMFFAISKGVWLDGLPPPPGGGGSGGGRALAASSR